MKVIQKVLSYTQELEKQDSFSLFCNIPLESMYLVQRCLSIAIPSWKKVTSWFSKNFSTAHDLIIVVSKMATMQVEYEFRKQEEVR